MDKFGNAFESIDWEKAAEGLHVHERCYITLASKLSHNLGRERKKMLKNLQRSLSNKNCRKKNVNHHHLNVCDKCVWCLKVFDKKMLLEKLKNWCVYQLFRDQLLRDHLDRVNYLSYLLNYYNLKRHPSPIGRGWKHINGKFYSSYSIRSSSNGWCLATTTAGALWRWWWWWQKKQWRIWR